MKSSELMIGDWLECNGLKRKVAALAETVGFLDCNNHIYWAYEGLDRIDTIPLTEEILAKNGFSTGKTISGTELFTCEVTYQLAGDGFEIQRITIYPKWICYIETATTIVRTGITYVHQLQHLLRLCGITDKEIEL